MTSPAEESIAKAQVAAARAGGARGLAEYHRGSIAYLGERSVVSLLAIAVVGLVVFWATASSTLLLFASLAVVVLLTVFWGVLRIRRIERIRRERARAAETFQSE